MIPGLESLLANGMLSSSNEDNTYPSSFTNTQHIPTIQGLSNDTAHKYISVQPLINSKEQLLQYSSSQIKDMYTLLQPSLQTPFHRFSHGLPHELSFYDRFFDNDANKILLEYARVWLDQQSLWRRFSISGNEMIISKLGKYVAFCISFKNC